MDGLMTWMRDDRINWGLLMDGGTDGHGHGICIYISLYISSLGSCLIIGSGVESGFVGFGWIWLDLRLSGLVLSWRVFSKEGGWSWECNTMKCLHRSGLGDMHIGDLLVLECLG